MITSFDKCPPEIMQIILDFSGVNRIIALTSTNKHISIIASKYFNELKFFYRSLTGLQKHYCGKQYLEISTCLDTQNIRNRIFGGNLIDGKNCTLILTPLLTKKEIDEKNKNLKLISLYNRNSCNEHPIRLLLQKNDEPKDLIITPSLGKSYVKRMKDTSSEYEQSNYWNKKDNLVDVTIFPIQKISVKVSKEFPISELLKLRKSVALANDFYAKLLKNLTALEKTINVNELKFE